MQLTAKKALPHILILLGFCIISLVYFSPVLQGKKILQSDIVQYTAMAKQQNDYRAETGKETYWTQSAFSGMPTYQLGAKYPHNYIKKLDVALRFLPRPADYLLLYFLSMYALLLVLKLEYKLALLGALAFGFSTYLIVIIGVGHNSKAHAIAYMPLVLSGILLTFNKNYVFGFLLTTVAMGLEICANHFQMTYYLGFIIVMVGIAYLVDAYRKKRIPHFFKSVGIIAFAFVLAIALNATLFLTTLEYAKESTRSKSELTINPDGSKRAFSTGLDKEYITEYSYGILETFDLYISRFMGGGNTEDVGKDSALYQFALQNGISPVQAREFTKEAPTYWGKQPIVAAPAYVGAVVLFLFCFALFLVKGRLKWWLLGATVLSLLLSYGKNVPVLTNFFIDYVPYYNKFRAVSSIQVILELCIPILAVFGLSRLLNAFETGSKKGQALKYTLFICGGIALVFLVFKSSLTFLGINFAGLHDSYYQQAYGRAFIDALQDDRKMLYTKDTIKTLLLILASAALIGLYLKKKLKENLLITAIAILILIDLVSVDKRYVNATNFTNASMVKKPFKPNKADLEIAKDTSNYRVLDIASGNARASYYHNSISGYHAAKLRRYNELYNFHIATNNPEVLNMLNTKYIIDEKDNASIFYTNPDANGNAWFVERLKTVTNANQEIRALDSLKTKKEAVIQASYLPNATPKNYILDSLSSISLVEHTPNYLKYKTKNTKVGFVVFSEIYYPYGWKILVDGKEASHYKVNYVLRGMPLPAGNHTIEFSFQPKVVQRGSAISLASSIALILLALGGLVYTLKNKKIGA